MNAAAAGGGRNRPNGSAPAARGVFGAGYDGRRTVRRMAWVVGRGARPGASNPRCTSIRARCRDRRSPACRQRRRHGRAPGPDCLSTPSCLKTGTRTEIIAEARPMRALDGLPERRSGVTFLHDNDPRGRWSTVGHLPVLIRSRYAADGSASPGLSSSGRYMDALGPVGAASASRCPFRIDDKDAESVFGGAPRPVNTSEHSEHSTSIVCAGRPRGSGSAGPHVGLGRRFVSAHPWRPRSIRSSRRSGTGRPQDTTTPLKLFKNPGRSGPRSPCRHAGNVGNRGRTGSMTGPTIWVGKFPSSGADTAPH